MDIFEEDVSYYLNNNQKIFKDVTMESEIHNISDEQAYPAIGEYEVTFTYGDQIAKMKIIVRDTKAPQFVDIKDKYEVAYNTKLQAEDFQADDLSKTTITLDDTKVNYRKAGEYQAIVIAKDESGNEVKQDIKVIVKEEEKKQSYSIDNNENNSSTTSSKRKNQRRQKRRIRCMQQQRVIVNLMKYVIKF